MTAAKWFRRTTWSPADAADFGARLERSRSAFHRAQYLRIQAAHLHEAGTHPLAEAAFGLLDQLLAEWPDESQLSSAHMQRAGCLIDLGRPEEALAAYQAALAARRVSPNFGNDAHHGFAELAVALRRDDLYDEALAALAEFARDEPFPAQHYRGAAVRAMIADRRGDRAAAATWAHAALAAAAETAAPFPRHRTLGLVRATDPEVLARLRELAAG